MRVRDGSGEAPRPRLIGVDAARGLALVGMMAVHVLPGAGPSGEVSLAYRIASGRSAATFAVLAGVGLALLTGGERPLSGRPYVRAAVGVAIRGLLIAAIGLGLGAAESGVGVILAYYGVLFLLGIPLLWMRPAPLAVVAIVVAVGVPILSHLVRGGDALPFDGANPTFRTLVESPNLLMRALALLGYYPALAWMAYIAIGLAAGRLRLQDKRVAVRLLVAGVASAVAALVASWLLLGPFGGRAAIESVTSQEQVAALARGDGQFGNTPTDTLWWLATDAPHSSTPLDLLHTGGVALAVLGLMLIVAPRLPRMLAPLAAAGSMTLTLYVIHVLALATKRLPDDPKTSLVLQVVAALFFAWLWRTRFRRGPLEAVISRVASVQRGRNFAAPRPDAP